MSESPRASNYNSERISQITGQAKCVNSGGFPSTTGPLRYRYLEAVKKQSLEKHGSYEAPVIWSAAALEELKWWRDHLTAWNGKALLREPPTFTIKTYASTTGCGTRCGLMHPRGLWSQMSDCYTYARILKAHLHSHSMSGGSI